MTEDEAVQKAKILLPHSWYWHYCMHCGAPLRGSLTEHKEWCEIKKMIDDARRKIAE